VVTAQNHASSSRYDSHGRLPAGGTGSSIARPGG